MTTLQSEILSQLDKLPPAQQLLVLHFARQLTAPAGRPGKDLLPLAGAIGREDLRVMSQAIAESCEQVDTHGW